MKTRFDIGEQVIQQLRKGETYTSIADFHQVGRGMIAGIHRDLKAGKLLPSIDTFVYGIEDDNGGLPVFTGSPHISLDRALVISDLHCPYVDKKFIERLPKVLKYYGIRDLVIAGDLLDGFSKHHKSRVKRATLSQQTKHAKGVIDYLFQYLDRVDIIPGNHDLWFSEDTDGELDIEDVLSLCVSPVHAHQVNIYPYPYITVRSGSEDWFIPHQADCTATPLTVGRELALKYQMNVITPHQHLSAVGRDKYNRYSVIAIGGLHNTDMFDYVRLNVRTQYDTMVGVATIVDGEGGLITDAKSLANNIWNFV